MIVSKSCESSRLCNWRDVGPKFNMSGGKSCATERKGLCVDAPAQCVRRGGRLSD